jgi:HTH-type transcriptional regulator, sugar sensing transcriptional regulator
MFVKDIQNLGLTEKEAKLYLTSLRLGPSSMQTLAAKARIDRGTAYHVAMTLEGKGLFQQIVNGKRPLFGVTTPGELYSYVEFRKREADQQFETMQAMYEDLKELYEAANSEE